MPEFKIVLLAYFWICRTVIHCETLFEVKELKAFLFKDYDATIRPVWNQSKTIEINIQFLIQSIISADMVNGKLALRCFVAATWLDENLAWNRSKYDVERLTLKHEHIWEPNLAFNQPTSGLISEIKQVFPTGLVLMTILVEFETTCDLNMRYYPMDSHYCSIGVMSNGNLEEYVTLNSRNNCISENVHPHGEWTIEEACVSKNAFIEPFTRKTIDVINLTILLIRKYEFSVIHKAAPQFMMTFANMFIHMVPVSVGERVSYAATIFLAFVFWEAIVIDDLPENSSTISLYSILLTLCMCVSTLTLVSSIILSRVSCETDKPIPMCLRNLTIYVKLRKRNVNSQTNRTNKIPKEVAGINEVTDDREDRLQNEGLDMDTGTFKPVAPEKKMQFGNNYIENSQKDGGVDSITDSDVTVTWLDVADTIDHLLFVFLVLIVLITGLVFVGMFWFR